MTTQESAPLTTPVRESEAMRQLRAGNLSLVKLVELYGWAKENMSAVASAASDAAALGNEINARLAIVQQVAYSVVTPVTLQGRLQSALTGVTVVRTSCKCRACSAGVPSDASGDLCDDCERSSLL